VGRGPRLEGLFGKQVRLAGGETAVADETYVRESILNPAGKVVAGYQPIMPTYQGLVSEEGLMQLVAYIQSLAAPEGGSPLGTPEEPAPALPEAQRGEPAPPPDRARDLGKP